MSDQVATPDEAIATISLPLASFRRETQLWPRTGLDPSRVREFERLYRDGGPDALPPIAVAEVDGRPYLADGWHRCAAAGRVGLTALPVIVKRVARLDDVYREALLASATTDKPLTRAEKRAAVDRLLAMDPGDSDHGIARLAGVSQPFLSKRRKLLGKATKGTVPSRSVSPAQREARKLVRALIALDELQADLRLCIDGAPVRPADEIAAAARTCGGAAAETLMARLALWAPKAQRVVGGDTRNEDGVLLGAPPDQR